MKGNTMLFERGDIVKIVKVGTWPVQQSKVYEKYIGKEARIEAVEFHSYFSKSDHILYWVEVDSSYKDALYFAEEHLELVAAKNKITCSQNNSSCPKCKDGELKEVYSDWAGENIKKCNGCGWC